MPLHRSVPARTAATVLCTVLALLTVPACSGPGAEVAPAPVALERTALRVGVLPVVDVAALQRADAAGYFAAEGLDVDLVPQQGGAWAVDQLVGGAVDMTFSDWPALLTAQARGGADLRFIDPGYEAGERTSVVVTTPESGVRTAQDLAGRRIAVSRSGDATDLMARSALQVNDLDPEAVQFVEVPLPDMAEALRTGEVDAALMVEPFLTLGRIAVGTIGVVDAATGPTEDIPVSGVATTAAFAQQNPAAVAAFRRAVDRARADLADRAVVEQTLPGYAPIDADTATLVTLGAWPSALEADSLQRVSDLMGEVGLLDRPLDVAPLIL